MRLIFDLLLMFGLMFFMNFVRRRKLQEHLEMAIPLIIYLLFCLVTSLMSTDIATIFGGVSTVFYITFMFAIMSTISYLSFSFDYIIKRDFKFISYRRSLFNILYIVFVNISYFAVAYSSMYSFDNTIFTGYIGETFIEKSISFLYFSFITFTTIGYGDISPINSYARLLVMLEGFYSFVTIVLIFASFSGFKDFSKNEKK